VICTGAFPSKGHSVANLGCGNNCVVLCHLTRKVVVRIESIPVVEPYDTLRRVMSFTSWTRHLSSWWLGPYIWLIVYCEPTGVSASLLSLVKAAVTIA
jgi:hypothetical protein